jgi:hypothetical protein
MALLIPVPARATQASLFVKSAGVRCPSPEQLVSALRKRLPGRTVQLAKTTSARPLLQVSHPSAEILRVDLTLSSRQTLHRELGVTSGQCAEAAATIGFLVKSWLEQAPLLSPEAPVAAETPAGAAAGGAAAEPKKGAETVGAAASPSAETANVPEDLELPIPARPPTPSPPTETVQGQVGELNAPAVVVVLPESSTSVSSAATGPSLMLLVSGDAAVSGTGTFPSGGVVPAIELGFGPHWGVGLAGRFASASSVTVGTTPADATPPGAPISVSLRRSSGSLLGGYQFFPSTSWGLELLAGPCLEYWSTASGDFTGQKTSTFWQVAANVGVRGSWRFARSWALFLSAETEVFFEKQALTVFYEGVPTTASTTPPILWFSAGLGISYVFL